MACGDLRTDTEVPEVDYASMVEDYVPVKLEPDLSGLSDRQRSILPMLIRAARIMDGLFWRQAYGDPEHLLAGIEDPDARQLVQINYGPWDRLGDNRPLLSGIGEKPPGANFYPRDMTPEEFAEAAASDPALESLYTLVRRSDAGALQAVPYHQAFREEISAAADLLRTAAAEAEDMGFRRYLELRAVALETGEYQPSDSAWLDMRDNAVDLVIGPIETYEDRLFGRKAAFEAYVLIKDKDWSQRLERFSAMLPEFQDGLPVADEYKSEEPGTQAQLNAYDVLYYAGDCNAGAKTIAINLPNDEQLHLEKGSRRLQLKNAMRAKFENILLPIADLLVDPGQRGSINFDAFFENTMFHEVAHGLGIKNTLTGRGTVREALQEASSALEEAKADILGLHMVGRLHAAGELGSGLTQDGRPSRSGGGAADSAVDGGNPVGNYVTFMAGILRSIRFGASSAHGVANAITLNYFEKAGAFSRDGETGTYRVDPDRMRSAVDSLAGEILRLQGDGDHAAAQDFFSTYGALGVEVQSDLRRLEEAGIPVDVVFLQDMAEELADSSNQPI